MFIVVRRCFIASLVMVAMMGMTACGTATPQAQRQPTAAPAVTVTAVPVSAKPASPARPSATPPPTQPPTPREEMPLPTPSPTRPPATPKPPTATPTITPTLPAVGQAATLTPPAARSQASAGTGGPVKISETVITLPTYPFRDYLVEQLDPVYNLPVFYFDRPAYEAAAPTPVPVNYKGVTLENDYLRLTFLPDLGGRLYSAIVKATGQEIFYHNPVVKPSRYGVLQPVEANWWLAAGGMEWAYPTQEHGYRWGVPWSYTVTQAAGGATITLSDTAPGRVGAVISVTLPAGRAAFTVNPRLVNDTAGPVPVQFWLNAALALGADSMSTRTRFVVPAGRIVVHSRGEADWTIPPAQAEAAWPRVGATDLRDYRQWASYLGFFVPYLDAPFMGAYNPTTNLAIIRLVEPGQVPGNKVFAFGRDFPDRSYTDGDSQYFELWGGANTGFWPEADVSVPAGGSLAWQEQWWPAAGLGGLTWATADAAIALARSGETYTLSLLVPRAQEGTVTVQGQDGAVLLAEPFTAVPAAPQQWQFASPARPVRVLLTTLNKTNLLDYQLDENSLLDD